MNKKELIKIRDYYVNINTRDTMISSRHCPIIRGLSNASDVEIELVRQQYIEYEKEYAKPINKVKRLVRQIKKR